jgi:signal transduction histidine kinase
MTLTTRLSLFFLAMLAMVLAGFSLTFYFLARTYLHRQSDERLQAALQALGAAVEIGSDDVEWEPTERPLARRLASSAERIAWIISDDEGRIVDRADTEGNDDFLGEVGEQLRPGPNESTDARWYSEHWQFGRRWALPSPDAPPLDAPANPLARAAKKYKALAITVGIARAPLRNTLGLLAATLAGVSSIIWLLALVLGRIVCRRALLPVSQMAASAREMDASDRGSRLSVPASKDELEDLSRAFNGLLDRLHESFERQRRFTGDASHQLRTPLTAILGQIEVALRRERGASEYREVLTKLHKQALHLRRIVEALLYLTHADAEAAVPGKETISLDRWLQVHLESWSEHPRAGDIRAETGMGADLQIEAQPVLLGELVDILLDNACKFSKPGSPITVSVASHGPDVTLTVADQGYGISEEDRTRVFEAFFRSEDARLRGTSGLGLGLAIATRVAEAFGGSLSVNSAPGHGSQFVAAFPRAKEASALALTPA